MRIYLALVLTQLTITFCFSDQEHESANVPRVLIIGDSTYTQHTRELGKALQDRCQITYAMINPDEIVDSKSTIHLLDRHLGRIDRNGKKIDPEYWPSWDLIHFNCGLGDLIHRTPQMKSFRVMPIHVGGIRNTSEKEYAQNLDTLVRALKERAPKAKLVWASTTPIRASASNVFELGSEVQYNQIAASVMQKHNVVINDMYSFTKELIDMEKPAGFGADPFHFDKKSLHSGITRVLQQAFNLPSETTE